MIRYNKKRWLASVVLLFALPAFAQEIPGFLEGPLTDVDPVNRTARVNGVLMQIPVGTPVSSPTVDLSALAASQGVDVLELISTGSLPGRSGVGFEGGTCLCTTLVDTATGVTTAVDIALEPAENAIQGSITAHSCVTQRCDPDENSANEIRVSGTPLDFNTDPRITSTAVANRGFELDLTEGSLVGAPASAEGYYGLPIGPFVESHLHYYLVDVDGGTLLNAGTTEVSVTRARCRQRDGAAEWDVIGATHDPATGTVTLRRGDDNSVITTAPAVADVGVFGAWQADAEVVGTCDSTVVAEFGTASTSALVALRIDDPAAPPPTPVADDQVVFDRAQFDPDDGELEVRGDVVVAAGNGAPQLVTLYGPGNTDSAGGCTGTVIADVPVDPTDLGFRFEDDGIGASPGTVCVVSQNGGSAQMAVDVD